MGENGFEDFSKAPANSYQVNCSAVAGNTDPSVGHGYFTENSVADFYIKVMKGEIIPEKKTYKL